MSCMCTRSKIICMYDMKRSSPLPAYYHDRLAIVDEATLYLHNNYCLLQICYLALHIINIHGSYSAHILKHKFCMQKVMSIVEILIIKALVKYLPLLYFTQQTEYRGDTTALLKALVGYLQLSYFTQQSEYHGDTTKY